MSKKRQILIAMLSVGLFLSTLTYVAPVMAGDDDVCCSTCTKKC